MTYNMRIVNDRPANFFPLREGPTPFIDYMGGGPVTLMGTPITAPPLVVGGGASYVFTGNDNFRFGSRVFGRDSVSNPFTLEAWFKPINVSGAKGIVGHMGINDGLIFDGEQIHFVTSHSLAGNAVASFTPSSTTGSFHLMGVHTGAKNELYVNGVRVASVDLTEEQINTPYDIGVHTDNVLYVGHDPGSVIIDSVAVYAQALTSRQAKLHFLWGRGVPDSKEIASLRNGTYWTFLDDTTRVVFDFKFDTDAEWFTGESTSVSRTGDMLSPAFDENGLTRAGSWQAGFILEAVADRLEGSKIEWDSDGPVTVQTSLDEGASWRSAVNGQQVADIAQNFVTTGRSLQVRVNFPAGEPVETITRMRSLSIKLYETRNPSASISGLDAVFTGAFSLASEAHQPIESDDSMGAYLYNASARIPTDSARTLEFWISPAATPQAGQPVFEVGTSYLRFSGTQWSTSTSVTLYVNGQKRAGAAIAIPTDRWSHVVAVLDSTTSEPVIFGRQGFPLRLGWYANYPTALTDGEVAELYSAYMGTRMISHVEDSGLRVRDLPGETKIYSHSWTLVASG